MADLKLIDEKLAEMDRLIVEARAILSRLGKGKLEGGELLTATQKNRMAAKVQTMGAEIETLWQQVKTEWGT